MQQCPSCQSDDVQRSRSKSWWEQWRKEITNKRPYRCRSCGWRGWGFDTGPKFAASEPQLSAGQSDPPNLKENAFLAGGVRRRAVSLAALDVVEPARTESMSTPAKPE